MPLAHLANIATTESRTGSQQQSLTRGDLQDMTGVTAVPSPRQYLGGELGC